ncbi:hypothetical protein IGS74_18055 [Aureimonas sp. OT7]|uniref:hypothetical protein n=1 Tax=Aureimonas sp. OT7 TaxID=2816454 RepID=UPI001781C175|nr:hypothetical protein [Aureimonas sp. OT7]QOG06406.1 hypothetical protein IGS74_18055 [Aureimonas sp. OT7]
MSMDCQDHASENEYSEIGSRYLVARTVGFICTQPDVTTVVAAFDGVCDERLNEASRWASAVLGLRGLLALIASCPVADVMTVVGSDLRKAIESAHASFPRPDGVSIEATYEGFGCALGLLVQAVLIERGDDLDLIEPLSMIEDRVDRVAHFASQIDLSVRMRRLRERGDLLGRKVRAGAAWDKAVPSLAKH